MIAILSPLTSLSDICTLPCGGVEMSLCVAAAWLLDLWLGDPAGWPHIVVMQGKVIGWLERRYNHGGWRRTKGALVAVTLVVATYALVWLLLKACEGAAWLHFICSTLLIWQCLAGTTLAREVSCVFTALGESLEAGRRQVARIVGRDTTQLSQQEVRTAAIETLAENLNDGVVAPLLWLIVLGVPGMVAYKMVNTLDSMIGYRTARYARFGTWAARIDDVAGFVPARITAVLIAIVHPRQFLHTLRFVHRYGHAHASPNSGYPEAAIAAQLNCRFGGPHIYFGELINKPYIGYNERPLTNLDAAVALRTCRLAEALMVAITILLTL